jgi:hypothetical protein
MFALQRVFEDMIVTHFMSPISRKVFEKIKQMGCYEYILEHGNVRINNGLLNAVAVKR